MKLLTFVAVGPSLFHQLAAEPAQLTLRAPGGRERESYYLIHFRFF